MGINNFIYRQRNYFNVVNRKHFDWFVCNSYIAEREKDLLREINNQNQSLICEVGCGEGANIANLRQMGSNAKIIGLDYLLEKIIFCKSEVLGNTGLIAGDGFSMPFKENIFDLVFCKNLLHHVDDKSKIISELIRVCKPGKKIIIIEGNGRNLINIFFRILNPVERNMKNSAPHIIYKLFKGDNKCKILNFKLLEPCNLFRIILHYKWGLSYVSRFNSVKKILDTFNNLADKFIPKRYWAYVIVTLMKVDAL